MVKRDKVSPRLIEAWLELQRVIKEKGKLQRMLYDKVTGLPTVPLLLPEIKKILHEYGEIGFLCINVVKYSRIEEIYGWQAFDEVMKKIAESLCYLRGRHLRWADIVLEIMTSGNVFVVLLSPPRKKHHLSPSDLDRIEERVNAYLESDLKSKIPPPVYQKLGCYIGGALVGEEKDARLERLVYRGLEEALEDSGRQEAKDAKKRLARLRQLIRGEEIHTLFQPMVNLKTREIEGYEALSRGPAGEFERPDKLFKVAYEVDLVLKLERLCRKKALEGAKGLGSEYLLFINVEPESVADPELRQVTSSSLLAESKLSPERIVLEITERTAIDDFNAFRSTLEYFRALGFKVSVDDAGAGYASLQCIAEVKPDFIKMDMSLVRGIEKDEIRQQLVHAFVRFANKTGVKLVAEGIETAAELKALVDLGVEFGQGYHFAYPSEPFVKIRSIKWPK